MAGLKKYSVYIILVLVALVLILLFIIITDVHVANINKQMKQTGLEYTLYPSA
jgi:uncharacterized membrane protein